MKKRALALLLSSSVIVVAGVSVAAIAGPAFYRDVIVGAPDPVPTVTTDATSGAEVDAADVQGAWRVGDGSYAGYRVDEVLNGTDVTVNGRTDKVTGAVTVGGEAVTAASFTVDVASITTDEARRDAYFRDTALQTSHFPTATFELTEPVIAASVPRLGATQTVTATGDLTLAGITRTVTVTLATVFDGERAQVAGSIPITFADYGIDAPNLRIVRVADTGSVEFLLMLVR